MSKIFEFNGNRQGTFIDSVSKTAMTPTAVTISKGVGSFKFRRYNTDLVKHKRESELR